MTFMLLRLAEPKLARLSGSEVQALRSLHHATAELDEARSLVLSQALHLSDSAEAIEEYVGATGFPHHPNALSELGEAALEHERKVEALVWRYASAYAVLGITVLERLVRREPPLDADAVHLLCQEPTLGHLRACLSIPSSRLLPPSDGEVEDDLPIGSYALRALEELRAETLGSRDHPMDQATFDAGRLGAVHALGVEPLQSLSFITTVATSTSWQIYEFLDRA
ncbi:hypothetical protein ABZ721_28210 [Streptomyces sp. NPDC006733]|uniref:hypothetical protein n=1 Tax=Streptomyces sp. NPDC006733 TaxID=3155460 RepID=UPI0033EB16A1